jgi:GAF domain-containing protein
MHNREQDIDITQSRRADQPAGRVDRHDVEMASLYEMASALAAALNLDETLDVVLEQVRHVLGCDSALVSLATADGQALRIRAVNGEDGEDLLGVELPVDQGINAWIYREASSTLVGDADADPRRFHMEVRPEAVRAAVGAPLIVDGEPVGTICAARRQPHTFTEADLSFLIITATHVSAALRRDRLFDQARQRAQEMETLHSIGAVMASSLDVRHVLQTIYEQAGRIMDTSTFFVALCEPDGEELHFELVYEHGARVQPFAIRLSESKGPTAHVIRTAETLLIHDWEVERRELPVEPLASGKPTRSWLGVPIIVQDQVLGAIGSQGDEPHAFTDRQLRLLSAMANQAGISLQNARLYTAIQQAHQEVAEERDRLAHLHGIIADVQRADALPAKLQLVAEGIHEMGWGRVVVSLCDLDLSVTEWACAGFAPEHRALLPRDLLSDGERQRRLSGEYERFRIGLCTYLPWSDPWVREHVREVRLPGPKPTDTRGRRAEAWHPQDVLYVPLYGRNGEIQGYVDLADPRDGSRPTAQRLHIIELVAQETALTIANTRLLEDLKLVNMDLQEMVDAQAHLLQTIEEMIPALSLDRGREILRRLAGGEQGHA